MSTKVSEYKTYIENLKKETLEKGKKELVVYAKDLHKKLNQGNSSSIYACCSAIKSELLEGDIVLKDTENPSSSYKVRYKLENMQERKPLYAPSKRGRHIHAPSDMKVKINKTFMENVMDAWFAETALPFTFEDDTYFVQGDHGLWKLYLGHDKQGRKQTFNDKVFHVLKNIDDRTEKYTLIVEDQAGSKKAWSEISEPLKRMVNLTVFFISKNGKVKEVF